MPRERTVQKIANGVIIKPENTSGCYYMNVDSLFAAAYIEDDFTTAVLHWPNLTEKDRDHHNKIMQRLEDLTQTGLQYNDHFDEYIQNRSIEHKLKDYSIRVRYNSEEAKLPDTGIIATLGHEKGKASGWLAELGVLWTIMGTSIALGSGALSALTCGALYGLFELSSGLVTEKFVNKFLPVFYGTGYVNGNIREQRKIVSSNYAIKKYLTSKDRHEKIDYLQAFKESVPVRQEQKGLSITFQTYDMSNSLALFQYMLYGCNKPKIKNEKESLLSHVDKLKQNLLKKIEDEKKKKEAEPEPKVTDPWKVDIPKHEGENNG